MNETRGRRSSMAHVMVFAVVLAGCSRERDDSNVDVARLRQAEAMEEALPGMTAKYDAQLADTDRAQRWREELQRWAEKKAAISGESVPDNGEHAEAAEAPISKATLVEERYQRLILRVAELRKSGAIGIDGEVPMWLRVKSMGPTVDLSNVSSERLVVNAWRLFGRPPSVSFCAMIGHDARSSSISNPELSPGQKLNYRNDTNRPCYEGSDENLLAFDIRRGDELVWVTRSRLPDVLGVPASEVEALLDRAAGRR